MKDEDKFRFRYRTSNLPQKLNSTFFLHNDVAKMKFDNPHFFNITLRVLSLLESKSNVTKITIPIDDVKNLSNFKSYQVDRPFKIMNILEEYVDYISNEIQILQLRSNSPIKLLKIFSSIIIDKTLQAVTFTISSDAEYLLVRGEQKDIGNFFAMRGEYYFGDFSPARLWLLLYTYRNMSKITLSREFIVDLCCLAKDTRPTYILKSVIIPALERMHKYFNTGSYYPNKIGRTIVSYDFMWQINKVSDLTESKFSQLKHAISKIDVSGIFDENETYEIALDSDESTVIWYNVYLLLNKWVKSGIIVKEDINSGFIITAIKHVERKFKCTFSNREELANYYDKFR